MKLFWNRNDDWKSVIKSRKLTKMPPRSGPDRLGFGLGGNQGGGWVGGGQGSMSFSTAKSFGNTLGQAPGVVLKKPMSFLQPSHLETHWA